MSHCFYVGNCIGERNHKFFILFLIFGFLKVLVGFSCSIFATFYIIYEFEMIQQKIKRDLNFVFQIFGIFGFLTFVFVSSDFSVPFYSNLFLNSVVGTLYVFPLINYFLHVRSSFILIYHNVI